MNPRILVFAGSTRNGSFSGRTADVAQKELALLGAEVTRISLADYPMPLMDEDLEEERGVPENAVRIARHFAANDGILIATPEYNGSMPPLLKNTIDWVSRVRAEGGKAMRPYAGKPIAICSSSNGHFAGIRSAMHLRAVLSHIQAQVIAPQCSVPNAGAAFDENGEFVEERLKKSMQQVCAGLVEQSWANSERRLQT